LYAGGRAGALLTKEQQPPHDAVYKAVVSLAPVAQYNTRGGRKEKKLEIKQRELVVKKSVDGS
jgi:hypothetical protein